MKQHLGARSNNQPLLQPLRQWRLIAPRCAQLGGGGCSETYREYWTHSASGWRAETWVPPCLEFWVKLTVQQSHNEPFFHWDRSIKSHFSYGWSSLLIIWMIDSGQSFFLVLLQHLAPFNTLKGRKWSSAQMNGVLERLALNAEPATFLYIQDMWEGFPPYSLSLRCDCSASFLTNHSLSCRTRRACALRRSTLRSCVSSQWVPQALNQLTCISVTSAV